MRTETIFVKGMFCTNCEKRVQKALLSLPGVRSATASFPEERVTVTYDEETILPSRIRQEIEELGYETVSDRSLQIQTVSVLIILLALYVIADHLGWTRVFNIFPNIETKLDLGMLFVIGLLTSVHCIAMCGGINLTQSTISAKGGGSIAVSNLAYNAGRVISYTAIGAAVGGIGSVFSLSGVFRGAVAIIAGIIMIIMALSMLGLFRPLRRLPLHLPAGLYRKLAGSLGGRSSFVIGLLNGLMLSGISRLSRSQNESTNMAEYTGDTQYVTTKIDYGSYEAFTVRSGIPVEWTIVVPEGKLTGCNSEIVVPAYDLSVKLSEGANVVYFTPGEAGTVLYSCWMGMIKSSIKVVE